MARKWAIVAVSCGICIPCSFAQSPPQNLIPTFGGTKPATPPAAAPLPGTVPANPLAPAPVAPKPYQQPRPQPGWELKPEHGEWLIEVKSYAHMEAGLMAEALAQEIKAKHKVPVYLYEWGAEARAKREQEEAAVRARLEAEMKPFLEYKAKLKAEAEARGEKFDDEPVKIQVPKYYRDMPDQYMVVVGGYKDPETARKALEVIRRWPAPTDTRLLDQMEIRTVKDGKAAFETMYVNPFVNANVVRNMTWPKQQLSQFDEFLVKLNEIEPMSIMRSPKKWTLMVKAFNVPVSKAGSDNQQSSTFRGPLSGLGGRKAGEWLDATAGQAVEFCKMLRSLERSKGVPDPMDAHVLHHRTGSLVTVGQYDSPDDPAMMRDVQRIQRMSFAKSEKKGNTPGALIESQLRMFDGPYPMLIPKPEK
jgi:hypothetical protein